MTLSALQNVVIETAQRSLAGLAPELMASIVQYTVMLPALSEDLTGPL